MGRTGYHLGTLIALAAAFFIILSPLGLLALIVTGVASIVDVEWDLQVNSVVRLLYWLAVIPMAAVFWPVTGWVMRRLFAKRLHDLSERIDEDLSKAKRWRQDLIQREAMLTTNAQMMGEIITDLQKIVTGLDAEEAAKCLGERAQKLKLGPPSDDS